MLVENQVLRSACNSTQGISCPEWALLRGKNAMPAAHEATEFVPRTTPVTLACLFVAALVSLKGTTEISQTFDLPIAEADLNRGIIQEGTTEARSFQLHFLQQNPIAIQEDTDNSKGSPISQLFKRVSAGLLQLEYQEGVYFGYLETNPQNAFGVENFIDSSAGFDDGFAVTAWEGRGTPTAQGYPYLRRNPVETGTARQQDTASFQTFAAFGF